MNKHVPAVTAFIIFLVTFCTSCSTPLVWGLPAEDFKTRLLDGTLPQLEMADMAKHDPGELAELGPGAAYFISFHNFADAETPLRLLLSEVEGGEEPYAYAAAREAAERFLKQEDYTSLVHLCRDTSDRYGQDYSWRRLLLQGLYWGRQDETAAEELELLFKDFPGEAAADTELNLFAAVLEQRIAGEDDTGWTRRVLQFFISTPAGSYHIRLYDYLRLEGLLDNFSGEEQLLLYAVDQTARNNGEVSWPLLTGLLSREQYISASMLWNLTAAVDRAARRADTIEFFKSVAETRPVLRETALEAAARLYRGAGYNKAAGEIYALLPQTERNRWYMFSSAVRSSPREAVQMLPELLMSMDEPGYYSDVLEELAGLLCESQSWDALLEAYRYLDGWVSAGDLAYYAYISARLQQEQIVDPGSTDLAANEILRRLSLGVYPGAGNYSGKERVASEYYTMMAGYYAGNTYVPDDTVVEVSDADLSDAALLVYGFLEYGLPEKARALAEDPEVSVSAALSAAEATATGGHPDESLRMLLRRSRVPGLAMPVSVFYPRPWKEQIEAAATGFDLPPWLLFSLIRRESLFNPDALSRVGAAGLMQLMPETAADVAARLRVRDYDLTGVEDNLRLGAWYLRNMLDRTDSPADAAASYNAGINRLRSWRKSFGRLPGDLFVEAIPYPETRAYIKALLVSSVHYGYLYYGETADRVVEEFFPDLIH